MASRRLISDELTDAEIRAFNRLRQKKEAEAGYERISGGKLLGEIIRAAIAEFMVDEPPEPPVKAHPKRKSDNHKRFT